MRQDTVIAVGLQKKAHHGQESLDRLGTADPAARDARDDRHHAEAGAAGGHDLRAVLGSEIAALTREAAGGMGEVPEVTQGLSLHDVEQRIAVETGRAASRRRTDP